MFRLRTFGPLRLEVDRGNIPRAAIQKRRLALLAAIANTGNAGLPRAKAALLLWPESDADSARHSLSQLLYSTKQSLSVDPMASTSGNLRLNSSVITSDVHDFDVAIATKDLKRAASLYAGPFLDGFNLPDSTEFEQWMESERTKRAGQIAGALKELASHAVAEGDAARAADWWKRLAALEPLDSNFALALMKALESAGNTPGALRHGLLHAALVRDELGMDPDATILAYANRLQAARTRDVAHFLQFSTRPAPESPKPGTNETVVETRSAAEGSDGLGLAPAQESKRPTVSLSARWNRQLVIVASVLVTFALALGYWNMRDPRGGSRATSPMIAVLPFSVRGDSSISYLSEGLVDLLSSGFDGAGDLRVVNPRSLIGAWSRDAGGSSSPSRGSAIANHFHADLFVLGDVIESSGRLRISASLYPARDGAPPLESASVEGDTTNLFALVDDLTVKLLAARYSGPRERLTRAAAVTTRSLPALKSYLVGESEFRAGEYGHAIEAFEQAVTRDTTFALAYYRMSLAAEWKGQPELESQGARNAIRFSGRLTEHDRLLVEALSARRFRNSDRAELLYRQIVTEFPDDVDAWYQLGEVPFHENPSRGRSFAESREAWDHVLALVPDDNDALLHLIRVMARTGSRSALDSTITAALPVLTPEQRMEAESLRAFTVGNASAQDSLVRRLNSADAEIIWQALWRVAVYGRNVEGAKLLAQLLTQPNRSFAHQSLGHEAFMLLLLAQGRLSAAVAEGAKVSRAYPWSPDVGNIYFQSTGFVKNDPSALRRLRSRFDRWNPPETDDSELFQNPQGVLGAQFKAYSAGLLSIALAETSVARMYAASMDTLPAPPAAQTLPNLFAVVVRAAAMRKDGQPAEALTLLENWNGGYPIELAGALGVEPYLGWMHAELLRENGRESEALRWYESRVDLFISEIIYLAPAALRAAEIYERRGDRIRAEQNYRVFVALWDHADPELQPFVARAREKIMNLGNTK